MMAPQSVQPIQELIAITLGEEMNDGPISSARVMDFLSVTSGLLEVKVLLGRKKPN